MDNKNEAAPGQRQEDVEDRPFVGKVRPEDYRFGDRAAAAPSKRPDEDR